MSTERDTKFQGFAELLMPALDILFTGLYQACITGNIPLRDAYSQRIQTLIAQHAYDLIQSGCIDINNAQMQQDARLHPHAMLRAVQDLTQWPETE